MDFTGQYQYGAGHQAYTFLPVQPLTPSHSASGAASDDFGHTSPPDGFDTLGGDHFTGYDYNQGALAQGSTLSASFPGPPTPPNQAFGQQHLHLHQQSSLAGQADGLQQQPQQGSSPEDGQGNKGGSEDDDMTPAQSRRKAQNRAAQRAFRERKEKHVKDLEIKLASLEAAQQQSSVENERLKRDLQKMSTENEILRATSGVHGDAHSGGGIGLHRSGSGASPPDHHMMTTGPTEYKPTDFYSDILKEHANKIPSHRIVLGDDGERLLAAGATWDYIVSHELYKRGLVDVGSVSERLKNTARCDGQGPVFPESAILSAIEQSVASGSDDLL